MALINYNIIHGQLSILEYKEKLNERKSIKSVYWENIYTK